MVRDCVIHPRPNGAVVWWKRASRGNVTSLIVQVLFQLLIIRIVKYLKLFLNRIPVTIVDKEAGGGRRGVVERGEVGMMGTDQKPEGQNGWLMTRGSRSGIFFSEENARGRGTDRLQPHAAQLQLCFCCSFIFFRTASCSTLTRFLRSSSSKLSQNSLMHSLSSVGDVFQSVLVLVDWVLTGALCLFVCGLEALRKTVGDD